MVENEDACKESCISIPNIQADCQSCIEEELKNVNSSQCLDLSGAGCFHCTKPIMIESIECSETNTNPEHIINCIQQVQQQNCKQCVCTILCYVYVEGDLCKECLQNSNLANFFLNHDKCPQSWTWSMEQTKCYKAFTTPKPWSFASTFCQNGGGLLAQSKTYSSLFTVLESISLEAARGEFWIGGRHMLGSGIGGWPGDYTWTGDNSTLDNSNWAPGYPTHPIFSGITASDVTTYIWSPNYPQDYFNNYEQEWELRSTNGQPITLTFESFDLDPNTSNGGACYDYVRIYDGISTQSFCGDSIPGPITSVGTTMTVYFDTSTIRTAKGFLASVCCSVDVITDDTDSTSCIHQTSPEGYFKNQNCGYLKSFVCEINENVVFSAPPEETFIMSSNYPNLYPNSHDEIWQLESTNGQAINLTFVNFDIFDDDHNDDICDDFVEVNDGSSTQIFCGFYTPGTFTSSGTTIIVKFHTNDFFTERGFLAVVCCNVYVTTGLTDGWTKFNDHFYKYNSERKYWNDARRSCQAEAPNIGDVVTNIGDLASVPDEATNIFLSSLTPEPGITFLGAERDVETLAFAWTDGTPWNFTSWDISNLDQPEPDNGLYHNQVWEPHMIIGHRAVGEWHDVPAGLTGSYLCQYKGITNGISTTATSSLAAAEITKTTNSDITSDTCNCGKAQGSRIVGGEETEANEYPWQVGLVSPEEKTPYCGGSIITSQHVLTAAHCTYDRFTEDIKDPSSIQVLVGEHDITDDNMDRHNISAIRNHPKFDIRNADYDFAILILTSPISFSSTAAPICLPASTNYTGQVATVTGWGLTSSDGSPSPTLQEGAVSVVSNENCNDYYPGKIKSFHICAGDINIGIDSCQGDSGGPLVVMENGRFSQIGIVSYGSECPSNGVYARVSEVKNWIQYIAEGALDSNCRRDIPLQPALLVTGGVSEDNDADVQQSAEVILPDGRSCTMPDLLQPGRLDHTQAGYTVCGGDDTRTSCHTFNAGEWEQSHTLQEERWKHVSWQSPRGTVLMGGIHTASRQSTELLTDGSNTNLDFDLPYQTYLACSIELEDMVVVTGGCCAITRVMAYNNDGPMYRMPDMPTAREKHACSHYVDSNNNLVYLVTGGYTGFPSFQYLDSTELLIDGENSWTIAGALISPRESLKAATLNSKIIVTGGRFRDRGYTEFNDIQEFDEQKKEWRKIGKMKVKRTFHAVGEINYNEIKEYCTFN